MTPKTLPGTVVGVIVAAVALTACARSSGPTDADTVARYAAMYQTCRASSSQSLCTTQVLGACVDDPYWHGDDSRAGSVCTRAVPDIPTGAADPPRPN